mmetsp:Transcript_29739/g.92649  ORF Transcript_29739/g.92649 Transcript_29739/m.92649 type:complete len:267 (-) Transcript_29739:77-877(-)
MVAKGQGRELMPTGQGAGLVASGRGRGGELRCPSGGHGPGEGGNADSSLDSFWHRAGWLVTLLALQSCSSFVLEHFGVLIRTHPVIVYFFTMLVGAGGNAGGQSTLLVVRRLALSAGAEGKGGGSWWPFAASIVCTEVSSGVRLAGLLFVASAVRCLAFDVRGAECLAICLSMLAIVMASTAIGAALPLIFQRLHIDPAHASAAIQVVMDMVGMALACTVSCWVLGLPLSGASEQKAVAPPPQLRRGIQVEGTRHGLDVFGNQEGQ